MPGLVADWSDFVAPLSFSGKLTVVAERLGGLVFYGGFIGAIILILIYSKRRRTPLLQYIDLIAPILPIGHAIGRIGCLLGGCCYGIEVAHSHPLAIIYPENSLSAPPGVPLLAMPLIESCCNLLIAGILFISGRKIRTPGRVTALYLLLYAPVRFILEFFRGDEVRGVYRGISTSQIISILLFAGGAVFFFIAPKLKDLASTAWENYMHKQEQLAELKKLWAQTHKKGG
jgi:phosphatidylglycerol:prolipoprotein diacylglycerol transferase